MEVEIADRQSFLSIPEDRIRPAVEQVLAAAGYESGSVSVAFVDDAEIHRLNKQYLGHDYPTDVLSFLLEAEEGRLEGQIVASAETARREAPQFGWTPDDELLLYVVHGSLHLVGYDDRSDEDRDRMRQAEQKHLARFGLNPSRHEERPRQSRPPCSPAGRSDSAAGRSEEAEP